MFGAVVAAGAGISWMSVAPAGATAVAPYDPEQDGQVAGLVSDPSSSTRAAVEASFVPREAVQLQEGGHVLLFKIVPNSPRVAPFEVQFNSYPNGDGEHNHGTFLGYNVGYHSNGPKVQGQPGWIMGMERSWLDAQGSGLSGPEWYVEYWSGDHHWEMFRPFYTRVEHPSNDPAKIIAFTNFDIGNHEDGCFNVLSDFPHKTPDEARLFTITTQAVTAFRQLNVVGNIAVTTRKNAQLAVLSKESGQSVLTLESPAPPSLEFRTGGGAAWHLAALARTKFVFMNQHGLEHMRLTSGPSVQEATTDINSHLSVHGGMRVRGSVHAESGDRISLGVLRTLPTASDGVQIGWANGIAGTSAGDLVMVPRTSVGGAIRFYAGSGTPSAIAVVHSAGLSLSDGRHLHFGTERGGRVGATPQQKLAFYGATPVSQPVNTPPLADDPVSTMALVNDLRSKLAQLGLIS